MIPQPAKRIHSGTVSRHAVCYHLLQHEEMGKAENGYGIRTGHNLLRDKPRGARSEGNVRDRLSSDGRRLRSYVRRCAAGMIDRGF